MRGMTAWTMVVILGVMGLTMGCQDNKNTEVAEAPPQQPLEKFPESAVPPPEPQPQPLAATSLPPAPPVDTTVEKPAASSARKSKAQPKESYASKGTKSTRSYVVKKGDTLQKISKQFYGTTKKWRQIYNANKKTIKDPDDLTPGMKLVIP